MRTQRAASFALFAGGIILVFAGLTSALGFSLGSVFAAGAAIGALLYAGGVWLGPPSSDRSVVLFSRALIVASGPFAGRALTDIFPQADRADLEDACRGALEGRPARRSYGAGQLFAVSPVRSAEGAVVYGVLLTGAAAEQQLSVVTSAG